jgi:hypothetical protein
LVSQIGHKTAIFSQFQKPQKPREKDESKAKQIKRDRSLKYLIFHTVFEKLLEAFERKIIINLAQTILLYIFMIYEMMMGKQDNLV